MLRYGMMLLAAMVSAKGAIQLQLPTGNSALYAGENEKFFTYVDRTFEGVASKPWEAGTYGMVRNSLRMGDQVIQTKFHEGIDISPIERNEAGVPQDMVKAISGGRVVHVSAVAGRSNYGKYVVIEHTWDGMVLYSLYAHLADVCCQVGDEVEMGKEIARLGYTGVGLDRVRAHLHLEVGVILSGRYDSWNQYCRGGVNYHGLYNGMNLLGMDAADLFLKHRQNPQLGIREWIEQLPVYFQVKVPAHGGIPEFAQRYPWVLRGDAEKAKSWEISFSAMGIPLRFQACEEGVERMELTTVKPSTIPQRYLTRHLLTGQGTQVQLTKSGENLVRLIMGDFPIVVGKPEAHAGKGEAKAEEE